MNCVRLCKSKTDDTLTMNMFCKYQRSWFPRQYVRHTYIKWIKFRLRANKIASRLDESSQIQQRDVISRMVTFDLGYVQF